MTELHIASIPKLEIIQEGLEVLVVNNLINLPHTYNVQDRKELLIKTQQANELIDHLRGLIKNSRADV